LRVRENGDPSTSEQIESKSRPTAKSRRLEWTDCPGGVSRLAAAVTRKGLNCQKNMTIGLPAKSRLQAESQHVVLVRLEATGDAVAARGFWSVRLLARVVVELLAARLANALPDDGMPNESRSGRMTWSRESEIDDSHGESS
jgi:hypothetical protein